MAVESIRQIKAEDTWTDTVYCKECGALLVTGTGSMTVTLQVGDQFGNWIDVATKTESGFWEFTGSGMPFRAGVKEGDYTSGTFNVHLKG